MLLHLRRSLLKSCCQEGEKYLNRVKVAVNNVGGSISGSERWLSGFLNKKQMFKVSEISEPC